MILLSKWKLWIEIMNWVSADKWHLASQIWKMQVRSSCRHLCQQVTFVLKESLVVQGTLWRKHVETAFPPWLYSLWGMDKSVLCRGICVCEVCFCFYLIFQRLLRKYFFSLDFYNCNAKKILGTPPICKLDAFLNNLTVSTMPVLSPSFPVRAECLRD